MDKYIELDRITKGLDARKEQEDERNELNATINESTDAIATLTKEMSELNADRIAIEAEVGPIKYIAELIYGESTKGVLEDAVRGVILIIVFVFDPLAVLLVVAANITIRDVLNKRKRIREKLLRKQRKNKILVKEEPIGDGTARKITKTKNGVTMEYYE